jgi:hypothetical protein
MTITRMTSKSKPFDAVVVLDPDRGTETTPIAKKIDREAMMIRPLLVVLAGAKPVMTNRQRRVPGVGPTCPLGWKRLNCWSTPISKTTKNPTRAAAGEVVAAAVVVKSWVVSDRCSVQ